MPRHPFLDHDAPIAFAHRGGAREAPENSMASFRLAVGLGYTYLETDMRATADGVVVLFHDAALHRITNGVGRISALPWSEVARARIAGSEQVVRLEEALEAFPGARFNLDIKDDSTVGPAMDLLGRVKQFDRVCIASFSPLRTRAFRQRFGDRVATSLAPHEVAALAAASRLGPFGRLARLGVPAGAVCAQVPRQQGLIPIVTERFIDTAHTHGLQVHVWTVDRTEEMEHLLDAGVDGLITDRPSLLRQVLMTRGQWPGQPSGQ